MKKRIVQIIIHIAGWACLLLLPFAFYPPRQRDLIDFVQERYPFFIANTALIISFYYLNTYLFIPKLLERKRFASYTVIILGLLLFYGFFPRIYHFLFGSFQVSPPREFHSLPPGGGGFGGGPGGGPGGPGGRLRGFQPPLLAAGNIAVFLLVLVFSTGIKVINQWLRSEQHSKEIATEKVKTELSFLKAQINPHFLFNTLNNIYALASDQSEHTAAAVMKLSNIMRYVLTEARNDMVPLEKEIHFISHYIELQKMRLTGKSNVEFSITGNYTGRQVAPLLLLPFVENAFKYGISTREWSPITILLDIKGDSLYFSVSNHKHVNTALKAIDNTGIGISNAKRRLDLLYHDRHKLVIENGITEFTVHLNIPV